MRKYLLLLFTSLLFISCKTNATLEKQNFDYDVQKNSISLQAYQPHGKVYPPSTTKSDVIIVKGEFPQTVLDSIKEVKKAQLQKE